MEELLRVDNIFKTYPKKKEKVKALEDVSFRVKKGELLGLLGPNGAGKTTMVKIICGLVAPDQGKVEVAGYNPWRERSRALSNLSAVLEGNRNIYWPLTVKENLDFFAALKGEKPSRIRGRIADLITALNLEDKVNVTARSLSRGMQQKLALAVALVVDVPVLILDEPTLGLDVESALEIREMLQNVVREENKTVLLTTHDMRLVRAICPRVIIINDGKIVTDDRVDNLLSLFEVKSYRLHLGSELTPQQVTEVQEVENTVLSNGVGSGFYIDINLESMENLYRVLDILRKNNAPIESIERKEIDLEEVFLKIVGRRGLNGKPGSTGRAV